MLNSINQTLLTVLLYCTRRDAHPTYMQRDDAKVDIAMLVSGVKCNQSDLFRSASIFVSETEVPVPAVQPLPFRKNSFSYTIQ